MALARLPAPAPLRSASAGRACHRRAGAVERGAVAVGLSWPGPQFGAAVWGRSLGPQLGGGAGAPRSGRRRLPTGRRASGLGEKRNAGGRSASTQTARCADGQRTARGAGRGRTRGPSGVLHQFRPRSRRRRSTPFEEYSISSSVRPGGDVWSAGRGGGDTRPDPLRPVRPPSDHRRNEAAHVDPDRPRRTRSRAVR